MFNSQRLILKRIFNYDERQRQDPSIQDLETMVRVCHSFFNPAHHPLQFLYQIFFMIKSKK